METKIRRKKPSKTRMKTRVETQPMAATTAFRRSVLSEKEIALKVIDALTASRKPQTILGIAQTTGIDYRKHDLASVIWRLADAGILKVNKNLMVSQHRRSRSLAAELIMQ